jgi:hypothetical protein
MTELYQTDEQVTQLTSTAVLPTQTTMPSFHPSTRQRTLIRRHLTDHDENDDHDANSIYKEALIIQTFQHWKIKTLEHQQATLNNSQKTSKTNYFTRALSENVPPSDISCSQSVSNESTTDKSVVSEGSMVSQSRTPIDGIQKRVTPAPASYIRRKQNLRTTFSTVNDPLNTNLLTPHSKAKSTTGSTISTKKATKSPVIFIEPKKTQPPPRPFALPSFDESMQTKRKVNIDKSMSIGDEPLTTPATTTTTTATTTTATTSAAIWAPAPPTACTRFNLSSSGNALTDDDDDETSMHESLFIRNKKHSKTSWTTAREHVHQLIPAHANIPTAIFVTDPHGHLLAVNLKNDSLDELVHVHADSMSSHVNACSSTIGSSSTSAILDKHPLHSIGEEEEEGRFDTVNIDGIIFSKELDRIEAFNRSRQTNVDVQPTDVHEDNNRIPLGRRWSDGAVSEDDQKIRLPTFSSTQLEKIACGTSSIKPQPVRAPVKISKTKYLLMKLHLTPSTSKDAENNSSSRKRTVRRSSDKKRYQTQ